MKAVLVIEGKNSTTLELNFQDMASIASNLADSADNADLFQILSEHPSVSVREAVAAKHKLNEVTVNTLAEDEDVLVIRSLIRSGKAQECLTTEQLIAIINRDVDAAEDVAHTIEGYSSADDSVIADALMKHKDPRVRNALARNTSAPKKCLKALLKDEDSRVRFSAKESLY